ncbi:hypothetical protein DBV15_10936, partial [Temnothorax longispinosus]
MRLPILMRLKSIEHHVEYPISRRTLEKRLDGEMGSFNANEKTSGTRSGARLVQVQKRVGGVRNLSNSTLHNTAGRTQAVNISVVQRMEGERGGSRRATKKAARMKARKSQRPRGFGSVRTFNSVHSLLYVIVFGSGRLEKLFPAGRQITARKRKPRPADFRRDIVSDEIKAARSRENLADDFIPSQYLAAKTAGITGMMKRISAEKSFYKKKPTRSICSACYGSPSSVVLPSTDGDLKRKEKYKALGKDFNGGLLGFPLSTWRKTKKCLLLLFLQLSLSLGAFQIGS